MLLCKDGLINILFGPIGSGYFRDNESRVFPVVERQVRHSDHSPTGGQLKKDYSYTATVPLGLHGLLQGALYLYHFLTFTKNYNGDEIRENELEEHASNLGGGKFRTAS